MNDDYTSGNLIVFGKEYRFDVLLSKDDNSEGIKSGKILKLSVFDKNDNKILYFDSGKWIIKADGDPIKKTLIDLIYAEFER